MDWKEWIGKRIFIKTTSGVYSGNVLDVDDNFLEMIDKFNNKVTIAISQIIKIVEENNGEH